MGNRDTQLHCKNGTGFDRMWSPQGGNTHQLHQGGPHKLTDGLLLLVFDGDLVLFFLCSPVQECCNHQCVLCVIFLSEMQQSILQACVKIMGIG